MSPFPKDNFAQYRILGCQGWHFKNSISCSFGFLLSVEKSTNNFIVNLLRAVCHVSPCISSVQCAITEYHRPGSLNNRNLFIFLQLWRLEVQDQVSISVGTLWDLSFWPEMITLSLCPHIVFLLCTHGGRLVSFFL